VCPESSNPDPLPTEPVCGPVDAIMEMLLIPADPNWPSKAVGQPRHDVATRSDCSRRQSGARLAGNRYCESGKVIEVRFAIGQSHRLHIAARCASRP